MIEAVTFDYWNTLVYEERGHMRGLRLAAWAGVLEDAGFAVERERLGVVFDAGWSRFVARWESGTHVPVSVAAEEIIEELGFDVPAGVRDKLVAAFADAGQQADLHLTDGVADTLAALKQSGRKLGIVCDVGMTPSPALRAHLDRHGLLELFDHWSFSDEVGCYKPAAAIFEHALAGLGVPAARTAHVGDLRRTDVAGARAMGMTSIRYTGVYDDDSQPEPEAHHVIGHHAELPALVNGGAS